MHRRNLVAILMLLMLLLALTTTAAADTTDGTIGQSVSYTGSLNILHGDGREGGYIQVITLTTTDGQIFELMMPLARARALDRHQVRVDGRLVSGATLSNVGSDTVIEVSDAVGLVVTPPINDAQPYVNLLCRFAGATNLPAQPSFYAGLFDNTGTDNYNLNTWMQQNSYGAASLANSTTVEQWLELPQTSDWYTTNFNLDEGLNKLGEDCTALADDAVNFNNFVGINMFFNGDLFQDSAWGGGLTLNLEGTNRTLGATWLPPFAHNPDVVIHEMGHSMTLPHHAGNATRVQDGFFSYPYDSLWGTMSAGNIEQIVPGGQPCVFNTGEYCQPTGLIGYHANLLGWVPQNRILNLTAGAAALTTLERLRDPQSTTNNLLVSITLSQSTGYFVEARQRGIDSDTFIPATGVVIYEIDTNRSEPALVVDPDANNDVNDDGAVWEVGETFDSGNGTVIRVCSQPTESSFVVAINQTCETQSTPEPTADPTQDPEPTADPTQDPEPTADPTTGIERIAPADGLALTSTASYSPRFQWRDNGAEWYAVYVSTPDFQNVFQFEWYQASQVCAPSGVCTTSLDIWIVGSGEFEWWMTYWSDGDGSAFMDRWEGSSFSIEFDAPASLEDLTATASADNGGVIVQWDDRPDTLWYNVWVGPDDFSGNLFFEWQNAAEICTSGTCTIEIAGTPPAGDYQVWLQAWNPVGIEDWTQITGFSVTP